MPMFYARLSSRQTPRHLKLFAVVNIVALLLPSLAAFPSTALAITTAIRQEINITDSYTYAASGAYATSSEIANLDSTKYNGATYYFEVVASTTSATNATISLVNATSSAAVTSVTVNGTSYARYRSASFTAPGIATDYKVKLGNEAVGKGVLAARIIVLQSAASITSTETQIEIGNNETYAPATTATTTLSSPKYWLYDSSKWDGSPTVYGEVTYNTITGVASTTTYSTAGTFTVTLPIGTASTSVGLYGGGGSGGGGNANPSGGDGGAGGQFASSTLVATTTSHTLVVAATTAGVSAAVGVRGATSTWDGAVVVAGGGPGGKIMTATTTGDTLGCVGQICFAGGNGGKGVTTYGAGGGGGAGTNGAGGSSTGAGVAGTGTAVGGGAGGTKVTSVAAGNAGTQAGGGGSGALRTSATARAGGAGAAGKAIITDYIATTTIAIQQDDGAFGSWIDVAYMVRTNSAGAGQPTRMRSTSFVPVTGRNYRIAFSSGDKRQIFAIYNAKIVIDQTSPTLLEPQYLVSNKTLAAGTGLQNFLTSWNSAEWSGTTNTYIHEVDAGGSSGSVSEIDTSGGVQVTGSVVTNPPSRKQSSTMTMPANGDLDVKATTNTGDVYANRILVQVRPNPLTFSGTLYADEGLTTVTTAGKTIKIVIATSTPGVYATTTCAGCNGFWQITTGPSSVPIGIPVSAFVDTGASPYFYVQDGSAYRFMGDFLDGAVGANAERSSRKNITNSYELDDGMLRVRIAEELPETLYLNKAFLLVDGQTIINPSRAPYELQYTDSSYLVMQKGDEHYLTFDLSKLAHPDSVEFAAVGYYIRDHSQISSSYNFLDTLRPLFATSTAFAGWQAPHIPERGAAPVDLSALAILIVTLFTYVALFLAVRYATLALFERALAATLMCSLVLSYFYLPFSLLPSPLAQRLAALQPEIPKAHAATCANDGSLTFVDDGSGNCTAAVTTTGSGTFTKPSDWSSTNTIEVIGGGGGGDGSTNGNHGGGGGAYAKAVNITLSGSSVSYTVGTGGTAGAGDGGSGGDTWFDGASCALSQVCAGAGAGGTGSGTGSGGAGGTVQVGTGSSGGAGGAGGGSTTDTGGAGGGAAGMYGAGGNGGAGDSLGSGNDGGGGGGGASGGDCGVAGGTSGGAGGANFANSTGSCGGGGTGGNAANGTAGSDGSGGGGGGSSGTTSGGFNGGAGGNGTSDWLVLSKGAGGGGGGAGNTNTSGGRTGGAGGTYGGGGGGGLTGGVGGQGILVITYHPVPPPPATITVSGTLYADEGQTTVTTAGKNIKVIVGTSTPGVYATTTCSGCNGFWKITNVGTPAIGVPVSVFVDTGASPFLYTWDGRQYNWMGDFLANAVGPAKEREDRKDITGAYKVENGQIKLKITEEMDETAFLDRLYLLVNGSEVVEAINAPPRILASDNDYAILQKGDKREFTFDLPKDTTHVEMVTEGYYLKTTQERDQVITVLNPAQHPKAGYDWTVDFTTEGGPADLRIIPRDMDTVADLMFTSLTCDGKSVKPQILDGDVLFYPNWSCATGEVSHLVTHQGDHNLKLVFGNAVDFAHNSTGKFYTITKASTTASSITNLNLYDSRVIVRHEAFTGTSTTIADMALYDKDNNASIPFTANSGTLAIDAGEMLYVYPGSEFKPGGNVTLHGNAGTIIPDGDVRLPTGLRQDGTATSSILSMEGNTLSLAGNWFASSTAIYNTSSNVTLFTSTSTQQKNIIATTTPFANLQFNGSSGAWTFGANAATTTGGLTITAGTVTAPSTSLSVAGSFMNNAAFSQNSGTLIFSRSATTTYTGLTFDTAASGNLNPYDIVLVNGYFYVTDTTDAEVYKYNSDGTYTGTSFDTAASGLSLPRGIAYDGTYLWIQDEPDDEVYKFNLNGTYTGTSFDTAASGNTDPKGLAYGGGFFWVVDDIDNEIYKYNSDGTYTGTAFSTAASGNTELNDVAYQDGYLWVTDWNDGKAYQYTTAGTYTGVSGMPATGGIYYGSNSFWISCGSTVCEYAYGQNLLGTITGTSALHTVIFSGDAPKNVVANASTSDLTIAASSGAVTASALLTISGNYTNNATFSSGTGTIYFDSASAQSLSGTLTGASAFASTTFLGAGTKTFVSNASTTGPFTINSGATVVAPSLLTLGGDYTNNGSFTDNSGTVYFSSTSPQSIMGTMNTSATDFNNLEFIGSGRKSFFNNASTTNFTIDPGAIVGESTGTSVYSTAGTDTYTVPSGVTSVTIKAWGAGGGAGSSCNNGCGGGGGFAQGTLTVTPGEVLSVMVGGGGARFLTGGTPGGGGAGGSGTDGSFIAGGGGGRSEVSRGSTQLVVAGGGGGGGSVGAGAAGAGGGTTGKDGSWGNGANGDQGLGGTQSAGGAGGTGASSGTKDTGGQGETLVAASTRGGGGGGGGYYGGGGGRGWSPAGAGGGGGSSFVIGTATGAVNTAGASSTPANTSDSDYAGNAGLGVTSSAGNPGRVVIIAPVPTPIGLSVAGNYVNNGTFNANASTVYLNGVTQQTVSGTLTGSSAFYNLSVLNTSGTGDGTQSVLLSAAASTTNAFTLMASTSVRFLANATSSFSSVAFNGTSAATRVWLRSSSSGTHYGFVPTSATIASYVDVQDASSCGDPQGFGVTASNGTSFDSGNTCGWTFSGITFSGTLFTTDETTPYVAGSKTIKLAVGTSTPGVFTTTTNSSNGTWSLNTSAVTSTFAGERFLAWVDGDATFRAATFTKASSTANSVPRFDLYKNRVTVKMEGFNATSTTNTDLAFYDGDNDSDIQFTSNGGVLGVLKSEELHIAPGAEFAPGGSVTLYGNASTVNPDGDLHLAYGTRQDGVATSSILTLGSNALSLAGNWFASSTSIFTSTGTVTFTSTSTQQKVIIATSSPFNSISFGGTGGSWTFGQYAATTSVGSLVAMLAGSVTAPSTYWAIGGSLIFNNACLNPSSHTFFANNGTTTFYGTSGNQIIGSNPIAGPSCGLNNVELRGAATKAFATASTTNLLIDSTSGMVTFPDYLTVSGNYANNGTVDAHGGTIYFDSASAQSISGTLTGSSALASTTFTGAGTKTFSNNASSTNLFTINSGATVVAPSLLTIGGNYMNNGSFTAGSGAVYFSSATAQTIAGTLNTAATDFNNLWFSGGGTKTFSSNASTTGNVTIDSGATLAAPSLVSASTTVVVLTAGSSWSIPGGVTNITVWSIGAGGGGAGATSDDAGAGGAGGAGGVAYKTYAVSGGSLTYSLGTAGPGGTGAVSGTAGGDTTATYGGVTITGSGGGGGKYNTGVTGSGGTGSGGDGAATGGTGSGATGDTGGGGGGAIGGGNGAANGSSGGTGGTPVDVSGLISNLTLAGYSTASPGVGGGNSVGANDRPGTSATGFGAGGGGAGFYGGNGGNGLYGGGGGGAAGFDAGGMHGGTGGQGVVVVSYTVSGSGNGLISIGGDYTNNGTFISNGGTVYFDSASSQAISGTLTGSSAFASTTFMGGGTKTFLSNASTTANFTIGSSTSSATQTIYITNTGQTSWTVPSDWNSSSNTIEVIGGGGGGATGNSGSAGGGGGGAGGAYAKVSNVSLTPGGSVTINIGTAGTGGASPTVGGSTYVNGASCGAASVCAVGGAPATGTFTGGTGSSAGSVGTTLFAGGSGASYSGSNFGAAGGGGAAGPSGAGKNGTDNNNQRTGGGGGGAGGGTNASNGSSTQGGTGGNSVLGTGGGIGGTSGTLSGADGTVGGGGGGGYGAGGSNPVGPGGNGGPGTDWDSSHGAGGGGGGGGNAATAAAGGTGGLYGGGGGGGGDGGTTGGAGGAGAQGIIVITYTPAANIVDATTVVAPPLLTVGGNYSNTGTFTANSGTVYLSSTNAQTLSGRLTGTSAFSTLQLLNSSATTTFATSTSATNFTVSSPNVHLAFAPSSTLAVSGNLAIQGTAGNEVNLFSSTPASSWFINAPTAAVSYARVQDSNACSYSSIVANNGTNIDAGRNSCWTFTAAPTFTVAANQVFTYGDAATPISQITVTDAASPSITAANDLRIAISTSTTFMLWDTSDTTATFGGTASGKVANPVSYEGGGSVLLIPVNTNFSASDTLTVSGLNFTNFSAVSALSSGLKLFTGGASDQAAEATNDKTIGIKGIFTPAEHAASQVANIFSSVFPGTFTSQPLYAFNLTTGGESVTVTSLPITLSGVQGIAASDITNAALFIDYNGNKTIDAGDTQVGGSGTISIANQTGSITFSSSFTATTTRSYILRADVANIAFSDSMTLSLLPNNILSSGVTSLISTTPASTVALSAIQHILSTPGGLSIGGSAPAGQGIVSGGGNSGGQTIGSDPNFFPPTTSGGSFNQWTTPSSAYASDDTYATAATTGFRQDYGGFGYSIPSGNTISGIEVKLELSGSTAAGTVSVALSWDGGTSTTTVQTTGTLSGSDTVVTLGGASNTWGRSWAPSEFADANFKVRLVANPSGNTVKVDAIQVNVHSNASGGGSGGGGQVLAHPRLQDFASAYEAVQAGGSALTRFLQNLTYVFTSF
jgi:hypothetical protein